MKQTTFFNTVLIKGKELKSSISKAKSDENKVLILFQNNPRKKFSPCDVWKKLGKEDLLTSYRRAITNLTTKEFLEKDGKKIGHFGKTVNTWKLKVKKRRKRK